MCEKTDGTVSLADLSLGAEARVMGIEGDSTLKRRLLEMGVTRGVRVRLVRVAPLGDPLDVQVRGYHLSLRREEARKVKVEPLAE